MKSVYIELSDFREVDDPKNYGFAPGKSAMLLYTFPVKIEQFVKNKAGEVIELLGSFDYEKSVKPKGVLHWVNTEAPKVKG